MKQDLIYGQINKEVGKVSRIVGGEGIILLKNEDNVLPLIKDNDKVAVFGRCQIDFYISGTGSGGSVNYPYRVNLIQGLENNQINFDKELCQNYLNWIKLNPFDDGNKLWANEPWNQKEMEIDLDLIKEVKSRANKAIIVIGRTAGEDKDYSNTKGSYLLTDTELDLIKKVSSIFDKVILIYNVSNIIDMSYINNIENSSSIKGIVYCFQPGMEGGNPVADVLSGKVNPSGKLTSTIAKDLSCYPSNNNFGSEKENIYQEDIYVGYRYFNTFALDKIMYEFGFGLSYTNFKISVKNATFDNNKIVFEVKVKNIGNIYSGKEVIQIYLQAPIGKLGRPNYELVGFKKTKLIKPGKTDTLTFEFDLFDFATYDDQGLTQYQSSYVLEKGKYNLFVGNSSLNLSKIRLKNPINLTETILVKKLEPAMQFNKSFFRYKFSKTRKNPTLKLSKVKPIKINLDERIKNNLPEEIKQTEFKNIKLIDVKNNKYSLNDFIGQLTTEELMMMVRGEGMCSPKVTPGVASCFGGISETLIEKYGIPVASCSDGPSGIRMDTGFQASLVPIGTLLASTWNPDLIQDLFYQVGLELKSNQIDTLLGPGINIQRHPLNGRNFEYYSEDPLLTGLIGANVNLGLEKAGSHATIKHFACNNQEFKRNDVNAVVSERALREIYLKPFQICVEKGNVKSIMTSYNPINNHYSSSNYDMLTTILRKEWHYSGIVMTDWWANINHITKCGKPNKTDLASMVKAQNDLYMVVDNFGAEHNSSKDNLLKEYKLNNLTLGELQRSVKNILNFLMNSLCMKKVENNSKALKQVLPSDKGDFYQKGKYTLFLDMKLDNTGSAQGTSNIYVNNQFIASAQTNGTEGKIIHKLITRLELVEDGHYEFNFVQIKHGIKIIKIYMKKD